MHDIIFHIQHTFFSCIGSHQVCFLHLPHILFMHFFSSPIKSLACGYQKIHIFFLQLFLLINKLPPSPSPKHIGLKNKPNHISKERKKKFFNVFNLLLIAPLYVLLAISKTHMLHTKPSSLLLCLCILFLSQPFWH